VAIWQLHHKHARIGRLIFGSQVDLLNELNGKPLGETIDALKRHYDLATQRHEEAYQTYSYDQYLGFLESQGLV